MYIFKYKFYLYLLNGILIVHNLHAQITITGKVGDTHEQPVAYATVMLLAPVDSGLINGTLTDDQGEFLISCNPGKYILHISGIGYIGILTPLEIETGMQDIRIGPFRLAADVKHLEAVVVKASKPFFEKKADRIDINVQNSISSAGGTVMDILSKSPGVFVNRQSNNIAMNGKMGVLIMINGKENRLPGDAAVQMLDGMSASNVEKIELITAPPAKYDASGDAGIINIIMKTSRDQGISGNAGVSAGYQRGPILGANFRLNQRQKRLNTYFTYSFHSVRNINYWTNRFDVNTDNFLSSDQTYSRRKPLTRVHDLRAGIEYNFTERTSAGFHVSGYQRNWDMEALTRNTYSFAPDSALETSMSINEINKWQSATVNLEFSHQISQQQKIRASLDYLYYMNNNPSDYNNLVSLNSSPEKERHFIDVEKQTPIHFKVTGIDYSFRPNERLSFDAGLKGAFSVFSNKVSVQRSAPDVEPISNNSDLDEKIFAAYFSWTWKMNPKLNIDGGMRYEFTHTSLSFGAQEDLVNRKFGKLFPNMAVSYDFGKDKKILFNYHKRITRPTFNDMAPFVFYVGPRTFVSGNLNLKPSILNGIELSYNQKQVWFSIKYSHSANEIAQFQPEIDATTQELILRTRNLEYLKSLAISTIVPLKLAPWWKIQNDLAFGLSRSKATEGVLRNLTNVTFNMVQTFTMPWKLTAELAGLYQSGALLGISRYGAMGTVNIGIKKEFKNEASLSFALNDLFSTTDWRISTHSKHLNFRSDWMYDWGGRSIVLSYSYNFGNKKLPEVSFKSGAAEERERVK